MEGEQGVDLGMTGSTRHAVTHNSHVISMLLDPKLLGADSLSPSHQGPGPPVSPTAPHHPALAGTFSAV